jgi:hypothetical protein
MSLFHLSVSVLCAAFQSECHNHGVAVFVNRNVLG